MSSKSTTVSLRSDWVCSKAVKFTSNQDWSYSKTGSHEREGDREKGGQTEREGEKAWRKEDFFMQFWVIYSGERWAISVFGGLNATLLNFSLLTSTSA